MPLDHYIPQVYLKNFCSLESKDFLLAIRKKDLLKFRPNTKTVCRVKDGSTNPYLQKDRIIEDFLKTIEPKYNKVLKKVTDGNIDEESTYVIAGLISYILTCSPAGMRIRSEQHKTLVIATARKIDAMGILPSPPSELNAKSFSELLSEGKISIKVDPKHPQAVGISLISQLIKAYGNFKWDILINPFENSPFFTSDYPIAIERANNLGIINRIIPLSPWLAVKIRPDLTQDKEKIESLSFHNFRSSFRELKHKEVIAINTILVRCAESIVFYYREHEWIHNFVKHNASFRIELKSKITCTGNGGTLACLHEEIVRISQ